MSELLPEISAVLCRSLLPPLQSLQGPSPSMARVEDLLVPGYEGATLRARLYEPRDKLDADPLALFLHGGGWQRGDLDLYDQPCRALADAMGCSVVSLAYRLAPAHRFPVPLLDAWTALQHLGRGMGRGRPLVLAGDSAGGALAAALCLLARDHGEPAIAYQVLIYPPLDARMESPSYGEHADAPLLDAAAMRANYALYAGDADPDDPLLSPLRAPDLRGLPPAILVMAEIDPVRDDGVGYARRLQQAGVAASLHVVAGAPHMALHLGGVSPACSRIPALAGQALRAAFSTTSPWTTGR